MGNVYRKLMDLLYLLCVWIAGVALVLISAVIPWAVFTRYVLNRAASWPEPAAVLLTIALTFFGAAACYRTAQHMRISFFVGLLPEPLKKVIDRCAELITAGLALFMAIWGAKLVEATQFNTISDFPFLSVGLTYLPIPIGGVILLLFVIERIAIGPPPATMHARGAEGGAIAFD
jgi:TRAP-type C4-dicarboxylate transport system permease small subunit